MHQSLYDRLINFINSNVPILGKEIPIPGFDDLTFTITAIIIPVLFLFLLNLFGNVTRSILINRILNRYIEDRKTILSIGNITKYSILIIGASILIAEIGLDSESGLNFTLFGDGVAEIKLFDVFQIFFFLALLVFIASKFKSIFVKQVMSRYSEDIGVSESIGAIIQYALIFIGSIIIIQNSGVNLGSLNVLAGALGVGIGFGMQSIANNFISGLIILFERPIKMGDRIEVGDVSGDVIQISSRATTVNTNDNISIIIPNSDVINKQVINWSHHDRNVRFRIPVGVSYSEDPAKIKEILLAVANEHKGVLAKPAADVIFIEYGDSSLNFELMVWTSKYIDRPKILRSELYFRIFEEFKKQAVEIPFPQRDLHLKSGFERLKDTSK
jgi:small-conductance mechanosensitive channel